MPVSGVAPNSVATSAWANSVAQSVTQIEADIYVTGQLTIPWAALSGKPDTFPPTAHSPAHATGGADALTPADIGAPVAFDTPAVQKPGKRIYVGTATPTGMAEGDIWVKG